MRQLNEPLNRPDAYEPETGSLAHFSPWAGGRGVLQGAFGLLGAVDRAGEAGLTRLASECGLPKTTAYRLLEQLVALNAVERCHGGYRMGPRMFQLGQEWQPHPGLRAAVREPVRRLRGATGATVGISALREGRTLVLDWTPGEDTALPPPRSGTVWPWFTAAGKVLVAGADRALPLDRLPASWPREAAAIRARGAAFDREEVVPGVCCVAVPLYAADDVPVAALCVLTHPAQRLERLADVVQRTGKAISASLRVR
ncbi:helix-turn-helix domain-containing protein [Streptomyces sp. RKAG293]|uniref:IclR family transcriptional regulator n=1 Tax=Streptomyces sp. RKAG293 TaxID=2893403 RepID=UPI00203373F0|nr:helix-turn-helix domain-containing protein [Streptomyces sp. RKAG293]MCM2423676.1 helix-turn-helix domain-containing protein [Streptomyces sp. RKAG293]